MFVATSTIDKRRINLLDPAVYERRESLKAVGREGGLACPHCGQELRVRLGDVRRPHFAHKSLEDCPFQTESAEVTEVKALLYGFFRLQGVGSVDMDVSLAGENDSGGLFLDLLVETEAGKRFGYWVFDRNRRDRHILMDAAEKSGITPMVIHTGSMLTFLQEVRFDPDSGDFVVEEDVADRLEHVRLEQEREEKRRREEEGRRKIREERLSRTRKIYTEAPVKHLQPAKIREPHTPYVNRLNQLYPCKDCGVETSDWVKLLLSENGCVCRECNAKRLKR